MPSRGLIIGGIAGLLLAAAAAGGMYAYVQANPYPRDPNDTLERVTGSVLRVGITENRPFTIVEGSGSYAGIEPEMVRGFAEGIGARVEWTEGSEHVLVDKLMRGELELVIGGFEASTPWKKHAGVSSSYKNSRVMLVPKGENRFLVTLERFFHRNQAQIRKLFTRHDIP